MLFAFTKLKRVELLFHVAFLTTKFSRSTVHICHVHLMQHMRALLVVSSLWIGPQRINTKGEACSKVISYRVAIRDIIKIV